MTADEARRIYQASKKAKARSTAEARAKLRAKGWAANRAKGERNFLMAIELSSQGKTLEEAAEYLFMKPKGLTNLIYKKLGTGVWPIASNHLDPAYLAEAFPTQMDPVKEEV